MGIPLSREYRSDYLYHEIRRTVRDLIKNYKFWSDSSICNELEVVYYNKLLRFETDDLVDASSAIGFGKPRNEEVDKEEICYQIVDHYKRRIKLLKMIEDAIRRGKKRLDQAFYGPVCQNVDVFVEDFFKCQKFEGATWISREDYQRMVDRYRKMGIYNQWQRYIDRLDEHYLKTLERLMVIVNKVRRDIDHTVSDAKFNQIEDRTKMLIKHMDNVCDIFYLLAVNYSR